MGDPKRISLLAPLSGVLVPLETIPDPVFAEKMVGDGISIDPTSLELLAPAAGTITQLHAAHHALTLSTPEGLEILLHIGLETVLLRGEGFAPQVAQGDQVEAGQVLIVFDPVLLGLKAKSLLTQMVIANGDRVASMKPATGLAQAGLTQVLEIQLRQDSGQRFSSPDATCLSEPITLPNPVGLHARPAAVLAAEARRFSSNLSLILGDREANAKSLVAIMGLATQKGDLVRVKGSGPDATEAVQALATRLREGCGESLEAPAPAPTPEPVAVPSRADVLQGVPASPGLAVGHVVHYRADWGEVEEHAKDPIAERNRLEDALLAAHLQIDGLKLRLSDPDKALILDAQQELLKDPDLLDMAIHLISAGKSAAFAMRETARTFAARMEKLDNALLRERANDIRDVGRRVLGLLTGVQPKPIEVSSESILVAEDLTPSETAQLDRNHILGFCTTTGGGTGHVAILARSLGIPAVCGIDPAVLQLPEGTEVVLDGSHGYLHPHPGEEDLAKARASIVATHQRLTADREQAKGPATTLDGHRIQVGANIRNAEEALQAVVTGADGIGLLRSEFLFSDREHAPSESEQATAYRAVAQALGPERTLVIRTLDAGGDKHLAYLSIPREDNPFLGIRGIRVSLSHPELFRTQLRAILQAAPLSDLHIMFPMVATPEEFRQAKAIYREEAAACGLSAKVGVMIEVPSAALMAETLAQEADFFSIGTNDLTQYALAMDRGHPRLAAQADSLHPAVLRFIAMAVEGGHSRGKWVGVCGGLASDTLATPLLVGLGVDELSVSIPAIPSIKARIGRLKRSECMTLAREVLELETAAEVRARLTALDD
ncbi:MAG: phosphoenolpyruvate-protein phosphotransferase [Holophagaceae bacterium]|nr:phosphoenolpyruvate-protein phosphotransferase [Holophagaceae bacterium]